jgi:6-phospho-beta-glucosidase
VGIKVAVAGGGSTYTPELVDSLCDFEDRMVVDDLVLLDPSDLRREVVGGLAERILRGRGWGGNFWTTADSHAALEGADFVVVQLRIGGQAARHTDETLPVGYGCLGQETVGAGGLAKALRTVPVVLGLAEEMADRANRGAWLVDFTNPVGIVTQALLDEGHRAVGLCNVAIWAQRRLGHYLGVDPDNVAIEHVGLNHLTWIRSARTGGGGPGGEGGDGGAGGGGVDRLAELFERFGPELELESGVPIDVLRLQHALPSYYLHYYYEHDAEVAQQAAPGYRSRADVVAELETKLLEEYRDPALASKPDALSYRGGAYYSLAAVRLMASLHAGTGDVQVVDMHNAGAIPGLPDDAVVETTAIVDATGAHPLPQRALPPDMLGLVQHAKAYERLAVKAACSGSRDDLVRALLANPLVGQYPLASELADELLSANREYLPRFSPSGS